MCPIRSRRFASALSLFAGAACSLAACGSASAVERYWYWAGSTIFETHFNGAWAGPGYWHGFQAPGPADTCHFSASGSWPGYPAPSPMNPQGYTPRVVYFGDFNYNAFNGGAHQHRDAVNAVVERVLIHDGDYEFNFGSGVGGWAPIQPLPSMGSLRINQQTQIADSLGASARLDIRAGTLVSAGPVHIAPAEPSFSGPSRGVVSVAGPDAAWQVAHSMDLGWVGTGILDIDDGATVTMGGTISAGIRNGSRGVVQVHGGGSLSLGNALVVGSGHESTGSAGGSLLIEGEGSSVDALNVFVGATGSGDATIRFGGLLRSTNDIRVGTALGNRGTITVRNGGRIEANRLVVGPFYATAVESLGEISGGTTTAAITGQLLVADVGPGTLTLSQGAGVDCAQLIMGINAGTAGTLNVQSDAVLNVQTTAFIGLRGSALLDIDGGMAVASDTFFAGVDGGSADIVVRGGGTLDTADLLIAEGGSGTVAALDVSGLNTLVHVHGVLNLGGLHALPVPPSGSASVTAGGRVIVDNALNVGFLPSGQLTISSGGIVQSGFARVARLAGSTGVATVTGPASRWISDTTVFVGGHTATGPGGVGTLFVHDGALVAAATEVRTWSQGVVDVLGGGRVTAGDVLPAHAAPGTVRIGLGGTLAGDGTIKGKVVLAGGTLSPGHSPGALRIEGELEVLPDSVIDIEVAGPAPEQADRVLGVSAASLAGTLRIRFAEGFVPGPFFALPVIDAQSTSGVFDAIELPAGSPALVLRRTDAGVSVVACPADFDGDGNLTPDDLSDYIGCYFSPEPCAAADVNLDGSRDPDDLSDYIGLYFSGC